MCILFVACGDALVGSSGFLTSTNFPDDFPKIPVCAWNITVDFIDFTFTLFVHFTVRFTLVLSLPL